MVVDDTSCDQTLTDLVTDNHGHAGRGEECTGLAHGSLRPCGESHYFLVYCNSYQFVLLMPRGSCRGAVSRRVHPSC